MSIPGAIANRVNGIGLDRAATPSQPRIGEAARELETQFAHMLIKSMRSTTSGDPLGGNNATYREMYDQQLARELTKGRGLGLASMIERQLERSSGIGDDAATPLDTRLPGDDDARALPLPSAAPAALPLRAPTSSSGLPFSTGGALSLAAPSAGVSMQALPMTAWPVAPVADASALSSGTLTFDGDCDIDCSSPEAFVQSIWPHAQKAAAELGVPAKALVAQAALETGWGRRLAGEKGVTSNNLFGIKAGSRWSGDSVNAATHEYVNGVRQNERARFRAYASPADSFADYTRLLGNDRYAAARGTGDDTHRFASALQRAGYATDPRYAAKLTAIANGPTIDRALAGLPGNGRLPGATEPRYAAASVPAQATLALAPTQGGDAGLLAARSAAAFASLSDSPFAFPSASQSAPHGPRY